jgi:hypothetical protein
MTTVNNAAAPTAGTMTPAATGRVVTTVNKYQWTNAMLVALGANTTGDVTVCTLPAKMRVVSALIVIDTAGTNMGGATLTCQLGTDATFSNFISAANALATANTMYGDADGEMGGNLPPTQNVPFLPSWTGTTVVKVRFITDGAGGKKLNNVLTSTGSVYLVTEALP